MKPLNLQHINSVTPYHVYQDSASGYYIFMSCYGVQIAIDFMKDDILTVSDSYQLSISNADNKQSPRDINVQKTILAIIYEFFLQNQASLLYICETGDGKQVARSRLFHAWFTSFEYAQNFTSITTSLKDEEGVYNSATLIIKNDHPRYKEVIAEFTDISALLRNKPTE